MEDSSEQIVAGLQKLGLQCDEVPLDRLCSATAALVCFPMYMVANVHAWTKESQFQVPVIELPGAEAIREALAIGKQESKFDISKEHRDVLRNLLAGAKASDRMIYKDALETIALLLATVKPKLADRIRTGIARMILAVAEAAGKGFLGTGEKISPEERDCIEQIASKLSLADSESAAKILQRVTEAT